MCIIPRKRLTPLPGDFSVDRGINWNLAENSVSILFVGDGFPVPLHSGLFTASPNPFGRFSRLLREAKRLPYAPTNSQFSAPLCSPDRSIALAGVIFRRIPARKVYCLFAFPGL